MHVSRKLTFTLAFCLSLILSLNIIASTDIIGYSGRLVQTNGTPVTGTVDLRFEVYNSTGPTLLETIDENSIALSNGIYTVQLTIPNLETHIENLTGSETLLIRVSDISDLGNIITYDYQAILSVPLAYYANKALTAETIADDAVTPDSLDFVAACSDNQVLIKVGNQFDCINQTAALTVDSTLVNNAGVLGQATFGTPGSYTSVTVDSYGRVSSGSTTIGSSEIADGSITNDDVSTTAAIAWSKIAYPTIDKSYVGLGNVINTPQIPASDLDNSGTLDSATQVPSELAVKGYVDTYADAKVIDDMTGTETTIAPSVNSVKNYVTAQTAALTPSQWTTTGSDIYYNTGRVGIGTTAPQTNLHINQGPILIGSDVSASSTQGIIVNSASARSDITFMNSSTGINQTSDGLNIAQVFSRVEINNRENDDIVFKTNNTEVLRLDNSGNIGIGVTAPTEKLEVTGNAKATGFCIGTDCISAWPTGNAGTVTSVTGGTGLTGGTITSTGTLAVDVGTTNGQIAQVGAGDKLADSIINYNPAIDVALTGFSAGVASTVLATDSILQAFGKVQAQLNSHASSIAGNTITNSDDVSEGSTNLYFTDTRAKSAAIINSTAGSETDQAASVSAMKSYVSSELSGINSTQWTTSGTNIYFNDTGSVGISTTNPDHNTDLHVDGAVKLGSNIDYDLNGTIIGENNNSNTTTTLNANFVFGKNNDLNSTLTNYSAHNVVVGNDNQTEHGVNYIFGRNNTATHYAAMIIGSGITNSVSSSLMIGPNDTSKITILNTGEVGIGTISPSQKLTVDGNVNVTTGNDICIDGGTCLTTVAAASGETNTASSAGGASLVLAKSGTDLPFKGLTATTDISLTENTNDIQLGINTSNGANELLRLDASGRVPSSVVDISTILDTPLTGFNTGVAIPLTATDSILESFENVQAQITANITAIAGLDTDDVAEGSNLYFTNTRAQTAAVVNSTTGSETTQAPSVSAIKTYVDARSSQWTTTGSNIYYNSGNVGVGTATPQNLLHVSGALNSHIYLEDRSGGADNKIWSFNNNDGYLYLGQRNDDASYKNTHMTITPTGNVGVGTITPSEKLEVYNGNLLMKDITNGGSKSITFVEAGSANTSDFSITYDGTGSGDTNALNITTQYSGGTIMRMMAGGNIGIGTSAPTEKLHVAGNVLAAAYLYTSDERFKENVETIVDPLHKVNLLRGVTFDWKTEKFPERHFPTEKTIGFIAQEVETVQPELVKTGEDGYKSVQYGNITALLVEAVKSVSNKIDELFSNDEEVKREIASLKEENEQLKSEMQEMRAAIKELQKANKK